MATNKEQNVPLQGYGTGVQPGITFVPVAYQGQANAPAYPYLMSAAQPQYAYQAPINNVHEETVHLVQKPASRCGTEEITPNGEHCENSGGCRWRRSKCCRFESKQPLGETYEFVSSLFFSNLFPVVSALIVFALESSQLARIGALYGNGNFFLLLCAALVKLGHHHHNAYIGAVLSLIAAIIFYVNGCRHKRFYLTSYQSYVESNPQEKAAVVSEVGTRKDYWISFFVSLIFPVVGTLIRICMNKTLFSRFGALKGMAWHFIIMGLLTLPSHHGNAFLLAAGVLLLQFCALHFRKAFVCATGAIFCC